MRLVAKRAQPTKESQEFAAIRRHTEESENEDQKLTVITPPVNVDAASVVAGELGEGETCRVGCGEKTNLSRSCANS